METLRDKWRSIDGHRLTVGVLTTGVVALSVHVVMLNNLGVPYPWGYPRTGWPLFVSLFLQVLACLTVYALSINQFETLRALPQLVLTFLTYTGLHEFFRGYLMEGWVTTAWRYSLATHTTAFFTALYISILVWTFRRVRFRPSYRLLAAAAIAVFLTWLVPFTDDQVKVVESRISYLSHDSLWNPPYDWHVMIPAYLTYVEPTLTCFFVAFLIWDSLPEQPLWRYGSFSLIVTSLNGVLSHPLIYPFFSKLSFGVAVLSAGQFFLESLALALLTGFFWDWSRQRKRGRTSIKLTPA